MNEACNTPTETEVNHIYLDCVSRKENPQKLTQLSSRSHPRLQLLHLRDFFFHFFATSPFTSVETVAKIYAKFDNMYLNNKGSN